MPRPSLASNLASGRLTTKNVADLLGFSVNFIRTLIHKEVLPSTILPGSQRRERHILVADIVDFCRASHMEIPPLILHSYADHPTRLSDIKKQHKALTG